MDVQTKNKCARAPNGSCREPSLRCNFCLFSRRLHSCVRASVEPRSVGRLVTGREGARPATIMGPRHGAVRQLIGREEGKWREKRKAKNNDKTRYQGNS